MAITNPTELPAIAFSKNDLYLVLESDSADYLAGAPAAAINYYEFEAAVAAAATIGISWALNGVTMTAVAGTPDGSGTQFPAGDGSAGYVTSLVPYFQANYFIDQDFIVSADTTGEFPKLIFTAVEDGTDYNFLASSFAGTTTAGVDDTPIANFAHHVEPWIDDGTGNFVQVFSQNIPLDMPLTGKSTSSISDGLHAFLSPDVPVTSALYAQCINSIRAYYVKYAQFFGDNPAVQAINRLAPAVITWGGLGMQPQLVRTILTELLPGGDDLTQARFLRQGSKNKLVTQQQPEWLTYLNLSGATQTATLEVTITNADSSQTVFTPVAGLEILQNQKFQFQAGFTQLNILGQQSAALEVVYYTVRLKNADGYITDVYNYVIDYAYREYPRYFIYFNSYGAFQTVATVGKGQNNYDRTKDDAQQSVDRETAAKIGDYLEANILISEKGSANIGYDRAGVRNTVLLRDLLLSRSNFLYEDGALIPIGFDTKNLKDAPDGEFIYANGLDFSYLYQEEVWTEDPQPDDALPALIIEAGSPVPNEVPPTMSNSGTIIVEYNDSHLSVVAGYQVYTAPYWLAGKTNYRIACTQLGAGVPDDGEDDTAPFFRTADISYNSGAGSFTIQVEDFILQEGEQLIIFPFILNPDS